jgi:hypothetical protein
VAVESADALEPAPDLGMASAHIHEVYKARGRDSAAQEKINGSGRLKNTHFVESRAVVLQAVGMITVQLGVPVPVALDWLQGYAALTNDHCADARGATGSGSVGRTLGSGSALWSRSDYGATECW